jgi:staphylococcal nuclease domain-containing protein 1
VDKTGTFLGSLFENKVNVAVALLENGLAKLHPSFDPSRTASAADLQRAEDKAKAQKIKVRDAFSVVLQTTYPSCN